MCAATAPEDISRLASFYQRPAQERAAQPGCSPRFPGFAAAGRATEGVGGVELHRARDYPETVHCCLNLFEAAAQAGSRGSSPLVYEEEQLTYDQLNRRANQLAYSLRQKGVGPDVLVGLYLERSLQMVVGLLGILKAGGTYVPLDPTLPRERLQGMLEDSGARLLVTQGDLPDLEGATVLRLDQEADAIAQQDQANPACVLKGENLVYVIYTSGFDRAAQGGGDHAS